MALLEKKILLGFYEFWLIVSVLFILSQGFNTYVLCHLYFVLAVPLLVIWFLYKDKNMTESILELSDDAEVRLFSEENGVSYVAVAIEGGYITGYIKSSMIKNDAKTAVRNVLIILAVLASVCGTATYFILRKKNEV